MKKLCEKIPASEKELHDVNFERLNNKLVYIINIFIDSENNMYLTVDSLININDIITGLKNITPRKVNV